MSQEDAARRASADAAIAAARAADLERQLAAAQRAGSERGAALAQARAQLVRSEERLFELEDARALAPPPAAKGGGSGSGSGSRRKDVRGIGGQECAQVRLRQLLCSAAGMQRGAAPG